MKYMGGKAKIANDIINIILKNRFDDLIGGIRVRR